MKMISIKEGHKTRYIRVPDDYKEEPKKEERTTATSDITCSGAKSFSMGFTESEWNRVFGKVDNRTKK